MRPGSCLTQFPTPSLEESLLQIKTARQITKMQQVMLQALASTGKTAIAKQQQTAHVCKAATLDRPVQKQRSLPAERQPRKENVAGKLVYRPGVVAHVWAVRHAALFCCRLLLCGPHLHR